MRRLFIMRKDLNMSTGKLMAQVMHCAEAYWTNKMRKHAFECKCSNGWLDSGTYVSQISIQKNVFEQYICGTFTKTVCEARNKNHLLKAKTIADEIGLIEGEDYGLIYDKCLTELTPEESDGTTLTGMWFCPLEDDVSHRISKKYQLYK